MAIRNRSTLRMSASQPCNGVSGFKGKQQRNQRLLLRRLAEPRRAHAERDCQRFHGLIGNDVKWPTALSAQSPVQPIDLLIMGHHHALTHFLTGPRVSAARAPRCPIGLHGGSVESLRVCISDWAL